MGDDALSRQRADHSHALFRHRTLPFRKPHQMNGTGIGALTGTSVRGGRARNVTVGDTRSITPERSKKNAMRPSRGRAPPESPGRAAARSAPVRAAAAPAADGSWVGSPTLGGLATARS
ncbi:hypothetical protein Misp02_37770 [Microtetraspora sp. NBRC 16547]|nr:hypothetical protein Misp02_37770 [Microtetraspora sp. NBRC 16547]